MGRVRLAPHAAPSGLAKCLWTRESARSASDSPGHGQGPWRLTLFRDARGSLFRRSETTDVRRRLTQAHFAIKPDNRCRLYGFSLTTFGTSAIAREVWPAPARP